MQCSRDSQNLGRSRIGLPLIQTLLWSVCILSPLCFISCKKTIDEESPVYFVRTGDNKDLKTRAQVCESQPHMVWKNEICEDEKKEDILKCNRAKSSYWNEEGRVCTTDLNSEKIKNEKCQAQGLIFKSGRCLPDS
ncbi:MAG: hypothetical protein KA436_02675 [Oligoflexales bacterium]|nr:hypothetical protein [Oligoflexales bacterium]